MLYLCTCACNCLLDTGRSKHGGHRDINQEAVRALDDGLGKQRMRDWWKLTPTTGGAVKGHGKKGALALMDKGQNSALDATQWEEAQSILLEAKGAYDRLEKDACRIVSSLAKADALWQVLTLSYVWH